MQLECHANSLDSNIFGTVLSFVTDKFYRSTPYMVNGTESEWKELTDNTVSKSEFVDLSKITIEKTSSWRLFWSNYLLNCVIHHQNLQNQMLKKNFFAELAHYSKLSFLTTPSSTNSLFMSTVESLVALHECYINGSMAWLFIRSW